MSSFPKVPRPHIANVSAIADFAEIECLRRADRTVSVTDIARVMLRPGASDDPNSDDDFVLQRVADAFAEIEERIRCCGPDDGRYPYALRKKGTLLEFRGASGAAASPTYLYLLLATLLNMKTERCHEGIDGTILFEDLSREVAFRFFGGPAPGVDALVFGTGRFADVIDDEDEIDRRRFVDAVNHLCKQLREGYRFNADPNTRVLAKDDKLDVVVWRRFADGRAGQLIGFGQCKTGSHWDSDLSGLWPESFCKMWMLKPPAVPPVRMYFITDRVCCDLGDHVRSNWYNLSVKSGILFDRCRIMEHVTGLPRELEDRIQRWVSAATAAKGLAVT